MAWHKTDTRLRDHPKLLVTAAHLEIKPVYLLGHLMMMWLGARDSYEDGDLSRINNAMIASLAGWNIKTADSFVQALRDYGWLDENLIHDWLDYAGEYLIGRYKTSNRGRLVEIWAKHGRVYGKANEAKSLPKGTDQEPNRNQLGTKQELQDIDKDKETTKYVCEGESSAGKFEGQFDPRRVAILDAWKERRSKAGLGSAITQRDKNTASAVLVAIDSGDYSKEQLLVAIDNLMADPEWSHRYSFHGFVDDMPRWLNRKKDDDNPNPRRNPSRTNAAKAGKREPTDFSDVETGERLT